MCLPKSSLWQAGIQPSVPWAAVFAASSQNGLSPVEVVDLYPALHSSASTAYVTLQFRETQHATPHQLQGFPGSFWAIRGYKAC